MIRILVTGFAAFPGVQTNPSAALMAALEKKRSRFARLGIHLETRVLPVVYEGLAARLSTLCAETRPDAILHFGVAARRSCISVETRARNRADSCAVDAQGSRTRMNVLARDGAATIAVRIPAAQIAAKIRRAGIAVEISQDAGAYLCNATLYELCGRSTIFRLASSTFRCRHGLTMRPGQASRTFLRRRKSPSSPSRHTRAAVILVWRWRA